MAKRKYIQATLCATLAVFFLYLLHHLPVNQLFIDPFSEAIKNHDIMDVGISNFRNHNDPSLFDDNILSFGGVILSMVKFVVSFLKAFMKIKG